jgi:hypothetical protein
MTAASIAVRVHRVPGSHVQRDGFAADRRGDPI